MIIVSIFSHSQDSIEFVTGGVVLSMNLLRRKHESYKDLFVMTAFFLLCGTSTVQAELSLVSPGLVASDDFADVTIFAEDGLGANFPLCTRMPKACA